MSKSTIEMLLEINKKIIKVKRNNYLVIKTEKGNIERFIGHRKQI